MKQTGQHPGNHLLFERARRGDKAALNEYCDFLRAGLIQIAAFRLRGWPRYSIEDIVQDTLTTFVQKLSMIDESPTAFVRGILYHKIGNELRRTLTRKKSIELDLANAEHAHQNGYDHPEIIRQIENRDIISHCVDAVKRMQNPCRTMLIGMLEGLSVGELWEKVQRVEPMLNRSAFDRRLYRCRRRLMSAVGMEL